jgi:hypothetical protein
MGMSNWLVGTIGVVIAGLVLLAIFKLNIQAQERSVSATQQRSVRTSEMDLLSMIEIDFQNIGSNYPDFELDPDSAIIMLGADGSDSVFSYMGQAVPNTEPVEIQYRWHKTGTIETKRGTVNAYQVERYIDGNKAGMSSGSVTSFRIDLLDSEGSAVASTKDTRQVRVRLSMASNLGDSSLLGETQWESLVRPYALARNDYEKYTE